MNVVATRATRIIARQILAETEVDGADAVLRHLPDVWEEQIPALIALLAKAATTGSPPHRIGRPPEQILLTEDERRRAHARHASGARDRATIRGEREYQRENKRRQRAIAAERVSA